MSLFGGYTGIYDPIMELQKEKQLEHELEIGMKEWSRRFNVSGNLRSLSGSCRSIEGEYSDR